MTDRVRQRSSSEQTKKTTEEWIISFLQVTLRDTYGLNKFVTPHVHIFSWCMQIKTDVRKLITIIWLFIKG